MEQLNTKINKKCPYGRNGAQNTPFIKTWGLGGWSANALHCSRQAKGLTSSGCDRVKDRSSVLWSQHLAEPTKQASQHLSRRTPSCQCPTLLCVPSTASRSLQTIVIPWQPFHMKRPNGRWGFDLIDHTD